jgi:hypothetical protein
MRRSQTSELLTPHPLAANVQAVIEKAVTASLIIERLFAEMYDTKARPLQGVPWYGLLQGGASP